MRNNTSGLRLAPNASDPRVVINRVEVSNNCVHGVDAAPTGGRTIDVLVRDATISNSGTGILAADGARVRLTGTTIFGNAFGLVTVGTGIIESCGDNQVAGNTTNGVATAVNCEPAPAATPSPPPPPPPAMRPAPSEVVCTVPKLAGLTLAKARASLSKAHCKLGTTTKRTTAKRNRVGRVLSQSPRPGWKNASGTKVDVTIGKRARSGERRAPSARAALSEPVARLDVSAARGRASSVPSGQHGVGFLDRAAAPGSAGRVRGASRSGGRRHGGRHER